MKRILIFLCAIILILGCKKKTLRQDNDKFEGKWNVVSNVVYGTETIGDYAFKTWDFNIDQGTVNGSVTIEYDHNVSGTGLVSLSYYLRDDPAIQLNPVGGLFGYTFSNSDNTLNLEELESSEKLTLEKMLN